MTTLATGSKASPLVIRVRGAIKVSSMASHTLGSGAGELTVAVTFLAVRYLVLPSKREILIVVEGRADPAACRRAVTTGAIGGKSSLLMIGSGRPLVVGPVATHAIRGNTGELPIGVAFGTFGRLVHSTQREKGMVEDSTFPSPRTHMADLALGGKGSGNVIGSLRSFKIFGVTLGTFRRGTSKAPIAMALNAVERTVLPVE